VADHLSAASHPNRRWRPVVAAMTVVAGLAATWMLVSTPADRTPRDAFAPGRPIAQNRPAPSFTRPFLRGHGDISLGSYRGSVVVVNFWQSFCRACRSEAPSLASLAREYRGRAVSFLGVDYEDSRGAALAAARSFGLPYPSVMDQTGSIGDAFGIVGLPTTYIVGPDQRVRYLIVGRIHATPFRAAVDAVLAGSARSPAP
jgi:cytochrome c biogenesis protein CcmG/thiol:disulfide interchange protein DsbE